MLISVISPYHNRRDALYRTLKTLEKSSVNEFEYVIVDDGSSEHERIEDFVTEFKFLKLIRIEPYQKNYINPCIPFNLAIARASGDIAILQPPECLHVGDVLHHVLENSKSNQYLVYSCYSLGIDAGRRVDQVDFDLTWPNLEFAIRKAIGKFRNESADKVGRYDSWYSHPIYRKAYFNFLVSMPMEDLRDLGGFDERFAFGHAADDRDFVARVFRKKMDIKMVEKPWGIHQYHPVFVPTTGNHMADVRRNNAVYEQTVKETSYKVKNSFIKEIK